MKLTWSYNLKSTNGTHYMSFHFVMLTSYYHQYTWPSFIQICISQVLYHCRTIISCHIVKLLCDMEILHSISCHGYHRNDIIRIVLVYYLILSYHPYLYIYSLTTLTYCWLQHIHTAPDRHSHRRRHRHHQRHQAIFT